MRGGGTGRVLPILALDPCGITAAPEGNPAGTWGLLAPQTACTLPGVLAGTGTPALGDIAGHKSPHKEVAAPARPAPPVPGLCSWTDFSVLWIFIFKPLLETTRPWQSCDSSWAWSCLSAESPARDLPKWPKIWLDKALMRLELPRLLSFLTLPLGFSCCSSARPFACRV